MRVYYFTRTGRSEQIAQSIANMHDTAAIPIADNKKWTGALGYIKAAVAALRGKGVPVSYEPPEPDEDIVVVFPVWAGKLPPAVITFVQEIGGQRIIAVPTSLGSKLTNRGEFKKIIDLVGENITAPEIL